MTDTPVPLAEQIAWVNARIEKPHLNDPIPRAILATLEQHEDLQAEGDNDRAYITSLKAAQAQICEVIGIKRGHDNWPEFIARVREQHERAMAALRFIATVADQAHPNAARQMADFAKAALDAAQETDDAHS